MSSQKPRNFWRRLHAFLAVGLAVFLLSLAAVGVANHGFRFGKISNQSAASADPVVVKSNGEMEAAADNYQLAREKTLADLNRYETANVRLQNFLNQHFADLTKPGVQSGGPATAATSSAFPTTAPIQALSPMVANPRWQELNDSLNELQTRRAKMLVTMQPDHPAIQAIDLSIADAQSELIRTAKEIRDESIKPGEVVATQNPPLTVPPPTANQSVAVDWHEADTEYRSLSGKVLAARTDCQADMFRQNIAWRQKAQAELNHTSALTAATALANGHVGADVRQSILGCGMLAFLLGALVALRARGAETIFQTAAQVRQQLGLAILGLLPFGPFQGAHEQPRRQRRWIRHSVLAAEISLAAIFIALAVASFNDKHFFINFLANPLAACSRKFFC